MTMRAVISENKVALFLLILVLVGLLTFLTLTFVLSQGGIDLAGFSTMGHCVSSGGVCTGA